MPGQNSGQYPVERGASGADLASPAGVQVVVRPLGNPLPLGFLALMVATTGLAMLQLKVLAPDQGHVVAIGVLVLTVPLQLVACVLGFLARDPVAGTGMGILAGTWAAAGFAMLGSPPGATTGGPEAELASLVHEAGIRKQL